MKQEERAELLAAFEFVDFVTIFPEDDILKTLELLKPDIHVKGGSFIEERIKKEKELIESWGGEFNALPLIEEKSTTNIINRVLESEKRRK